MSLFYLFYTILPWDIFHGLYVPKLKKKKNYYSNLKHNNLDEAVTKDERMKAVNVSQRQESYDN